MRVRLMAVLAMSFACVSFAHAKIIDRVVAVVNDNAITQSDINLFRTQLKTHGLLDEGLLSLYNVSKLKKKESADVQYLIDQKIIDSEVASSGIVTPIEQVDSEINNIAQGRGITLEQLKETLKNQGVSYAQYQDFVRTSMERQTLLEREVTSKITVSNNEIDAFYAKQKHGKNPLVYEYKLSHIFFADTNGGAAAAKARAEEVKEKLDDGIPFTTLAAQYSEDKQYSQNAGDFGTYRLSDLNPKIRAILAPLSAGDISPVVKMADGYHIFRVDKKILVPSPGLEAKRDAIRRYLMGIYFKRRFREWLKKRRAESFIHINKISNGKWQS